MVLFPKGSLPPFIPGANMNTIQDKLGRSFKKLRVSMTEACNYSCFYCMPDSANFPSKDEYLNALEYQDICSRLVGFGIDEIRLTGGEPTIRPDFLNIVEKLSTLNLKKFAITTNGQIIAPMIPKLKKFGINNINFSLDTLDHGKFERITKSGNLQKVMRGIYSALEFQIPIKINCVSMKGINDNELLDFIYWSAEHRVEVRFLEVMKIGSGNQANNKHYISNNELLQRIQLLFRINKVSVEKDSTSQVYDLENGARIGFISSESEPFCSTCSRLRLTAKGVLKGCLFKEDGLNLKAPENKDYAKVLSQLLTNKPQGRVSSVQHSMHSIGG